MLPHGHSGLFRSTTGRRIASVRTLHQVGFTARTCLQAAGELLPRLSILTLLAQSGFFLLHFPWSCLHRPLAGTLPCDARTFLTVSRAIAWPPDSLFSVSRLRAGVKHCLQQKRANLQIRNFQFREIARRISPTGGVWRMKQHLSKSYHR